MPVLRSTAGPEACEIYYEIRQSPTAEARFDDRNSVNVVLIMGFGATHQCWEPQLEQLLSREQTTPTRCLLMDNRGVGRTGAPASTSAYTTSIMAADVYALMEHVGWEHAHVVGHSMGAMIALKLASAHPERIDSLTLISTTGGRFQSIPRGWRALWYAFQLMMAKKVEDRAMVDLKFHFMHSTLDEVRSQGSKTGRTRWDLLAEEYVEGQRGGGIGQNNDGFHGQMHAVWHHTATSTDVSRVRSGKFPVLVIHGRHDLLAAPKFGEALAHRLGAPCIMLEGAHMLCRECGYHINLLLDHIIYHARALVRRRHHYLDHSANASDPDGVPCSCRVSADVACDAHAVMELGQSAQHGGCLQGRHQGDDGPKRAGTPDSEASAASHTGLLTR
ncbi:hypothetical protein WJX73_006862 [Symbiochloris irregularis]|uniref:AB hydrolase-1 domain-containing protein n=1 Tax=Symbiochloris irregularis TaxID=706552 RepID=A0AAW1NNK4_9CHLO